MEQRNQEDIVIEQAIKYGYISRNWCLNNYISRLSAVIMRLDKRGYKFPKEERGYVKTESGQDFRYYLLK